jgi:nitrogen fixation NifU-like protein
VPAVGEGAGPVEALYRDVILDHYRRPRNRRPLEQPDGFALVDNPVCGDQVKVEVRLEGERIAEVSARSRGCSIAVAAGSVMTELTRGGTLARAAELDRAAQALVAGEAACDELDRRLLAFRGVSRFPSRRRCALLAWEALAEAIRAARGEGG